MAKDVGRLVLAIEVTADLQRADALRAVHEQGDGAENVAVAHLAACEDGAAGQAELLAAVLAPEDAPRAVAVNGQRAAVRAMGLATFPPDRLERLVGFLIGEAEDLGQREGPGLGGEKEVLRHRIVPVFASYVANIGTLCHSCKGLYLTFRGIFRMWGDMAETDWHDLVKNILKAELKRRGVTYQQLSERLAAIGVHESEKTIRNKLSRGGFAAVFFVQCLHALGAKTVRLDEEA